MHFGVAWLKKGFNQGVQTCWSTPPALPHSAQHSPSLRLRSLRRCRGRQWCWPSMLMSQCSGSSHTSHLRPYRCSTWAQNSLSASKSQWSKSQKIEDFLMFFTGIFEFLGEQKLKFHCIWSVFAQFCWPKILTLQLATECRAFGEAKEDAFPAARRIGQFQVWKKHVKHPVVYLKSGLVLND